MRYGAVFLDDGPRDGKLNRAVVVPLRRGAEGGGDTMARLQKAFLASEAKRLAAPWMAPSRVMSLERLMEAMLLLPGRAKRSLASPAL